MSAAADELVRHVLSRYPRELRTARVEPLGNRGGFSGARLWRLHTPAGAWALRAAAPAEAAAQVAWRHGLMALARAAGGHFVPAVLPADIGTFVEAGGRCWEVQEWVPGVADYRDRPSPRKLAAALRALAAVHRAWDARAEATASPVPAVRRRLEAARLPAATPHPRLAPLLQVWLPRVPAMLAEWAGRRARLRPCLRDVWHDHVLFEGERVTGLVDYAAMAMDDAATDIARLVGSLVGDDDAGWAAALAAYREVRPLAEDEGRLARALDRTGTVVALATWARWLGARTFEDAAAVERRVGELMRRVEGWGE